MTIGRRAFLRGGTLVLLGAGLDWTAAGELFAGEERSKQSVRAGLVTDLHYADKPELGTRYYRETLTKLAEAVDQFQKDLPDFVVHLGDLIDAADSVEAEKGYLSAVVGALSKAPGKKHFVLGNHCVYTLTKPEFLEGVGQKASYDSFDSGGFHFVVLDACFRSDGTPYGRKNFQTVDTNVPAAELDWLRQDLKTAASKTIVFVHQRLDVSSAVGVRNAKDVRQVLEESGKVLAVFQGHSHLNDYQEISHIHYCTLRAMVEGSGARNNGFSTMDISADGTIRISGYREQKSYKWSPA